MKFPSSPDFSEDPVTFPAFFLFTFPGFFRIPVAGGLYGPPQFTQEDVDSLRVREVVGKEEMVEKEEMEVMMKKEEVEEEEEEKELSKEHDCKKSICSLCKVGTRTQYTRCTAEYF